MITALLSMILKFYDFIVVCRFIVIISIDFKFLLKKTKVIVLVM